jgi:Holliday junction resolvase
VGNSQRRKGVEGERQVRNVLVRHGWTVRGLEGSGDWIAIRFGVVLHVEVKRQEVLRLPLWTRQAIAEAPDGAVPVVAYRRNREIWRALAPRPSDGHYPACCELVEIGGREWFRLSLADLALIVDRSWVPPAHRPPPPWPAEQSSGSGGV